MIIDLHSHTNFSFCGSDDPFELAREMRTHGVNALGITDHNYGIQGRENEYFAVIKELKNQYKDMTVYGGVEISTLPRYIPKDLSFYKNLDYCIVEHLDFEDTEIGIGICDFAKKLGVKTGIAHTDLFALAKKYGVSPSAFFRELKEQGIFWEMNVNYDSIHGYREHAYVKEFFTNIEQQKIVKDVGLELSVGFDGHRKADYQVTRVKDACEFLESNGFGLVKGFY